MFPASSTRPAHRPRSNPGHRFAVSVPLGAVWGALVGLALAAALAPRAAAATQGVDGPQAVTPDAPQDVTATDAPALPPLPPMPPPMAPAADDDADDQPHGVLQLAVAGRATTGRYSTFAVDDSGVRSRKGWEGRSRLATRMDLKTSDRPGGLTLTARLGVEVASGTFAGQPTLRGDHLPGSDWSAVLPVDAWLGMDWGETIGARAGLMTSQWGMGLVANDGMSMLDDRNEDWFTLPEVGDRVTRLALWAAPWRGTTSSARGLMFSAALDRVVQDDVADAAQGETATQAVLATRMFFSKTRWAGLYYVYRSQEHDDGKFLRVHVIDLATDLRFGPKDGGLRVQAEAVSILGATSFAPSPEFPEHDVRQMGLAGRLSWGKARSGPRLELDAGWSSGDGNMDDETLTGFKADPNHQQGLILFRRVLGWQTGRARVTASNPLVVGRPVEDLDRLASGGSVTSAFTLFPKVGYGFGDHVQIYTGALIAVATADLVDPFHTRTLGGGSPRNFLGVQATGSTLGTELAVGTRIRLPIKSIRSNIWLGAEYARLVTGGALEGMGRDSPVHGGRLMLSFNPDATPEEAQEVQQ